MPFDDVFHALRDPTRREILKVLRDGDRTAGEIAQRFPLARSTLSGHFRVLKHAGLVVTERQGTRVVYSLNASAFEDAMAWLLDLLRGSLQNAPPESAAADTRGGAAVAALPCRTRVPNGA